MNNNEDALRRNKMGKAGLPSKFCCGKCNYHGQDEDSKDDWICVDPNSEYFGCYTEDEDVCKERDEDGELW